VIATNNNTMNTIKKFWHVFLIIYYKLAFITGGVLPDEYYVKTAIQWMDLDNYKRAILNLEIAIKFYDVSYVRYYLAWCYQNLGEYEKACVNYNKAYEKKKDMIYLIYVAYCEFCLGNKEKATQMINEIKEKHIDDRLVKEFERIEKIISTNKNI
jgi:tetratricopeptide (TPR) repeat protein